MSDPHNWWFETTRFADVLESEMPVNPGRFGGTLARWLADELKQRGWTVADVYTEDWGWMVEVHREGDRLRVACGNEDGSVTRWLASAHAAPTLMQRLRRRTASGDAWAEKLHEDVGKIIQSDQQTSWSGLEQPDDDSEAKP